jgi:hypothetical protein
MLTMQQEPAIEWPARLRSNFGIGLKIYVPLIIEETCLNGKRFC